MTEKSPVPDYASPPTQQRFPDWDYLTFFALSCFCVGVPAAPLLLIDRFKRVFDDFKLKLPGPTQLLIDFYDALNAFYAPYWVWLIPLLLPLWLIRLDRDVRLRVAILMMLLAGLAVVWFTIAMFMPMFSLIEGMTSR